MTPEKFKSLKVGDVIYWTHRPKCIARIDRLDTHISLYYLSGDNDIKSLNHRSPRKLRNFIGDPQFKFIKLLSNSQKLELL